MSTPINETLCHHHGGVSTLPGLDNTNLYCLTPNIQDTNAISHIVQSCCGANPVRQLGGCDYCVIDEPTAWSNASSDEYGYSNGWGDCLFTRANAANVSMIAASCNSPSSGAAGLLAAGGGGRAAWGVWGLVVLVGFGLVEGGLV